MISRLELQQGITAAHILESQGKNHQQAKMAARHDSLSPAEEPRIGMISKLELAAMQPVPQ